MDKKCIESYILYINSLRPSVCPSDTTILHFNSPVELLCHSACSREGWMERRRERGASERQRERERGTKSCAF